MHITCTRYVCVCTLCNQKYMTTYIQRCIIFRPPFEPFSSQNSSLLRVYAKLHTHWTHAIYK